MTGAEPTPGSVLKSSITEASRKIESIINDAERAALEIRAHAEADAERQSEVVLEESATRLAAIVDPLLARIESLQTEVAALARDFDTATTDLKALAGILSPTPATPDPVVSPDPVTSPAPSEAPEPQADVPEAVGSEMPPVTSAPAPVVAYPGKAAPPPPSRPEEVVLRATQMAVSGSSRAEMISSLEREFALTDAAAVVDDILGT